MAIHDFQGHEIHIKEFKADYSSFSGKLVFHFYDHFGLDDDDFQYLPGFGHWFVLQHHTKYNGKYVPYIPVVEFDSEGNFSYSN